MAGEKLDITEDNQGYKIAWFGGEDEAEGDLFLGESVEEAADHTAASEAVRTLADFTVFGGALGWDTRSGARKALIVARAAAKAAQLNRELEPWEKTALANGWKPPHGWKGKA